MRTVCLFLFLHFDDRSSNEQPFCPLCHLSESEQTANLRAMDAKSAWGIKIMFSMKSFLLRGENHVQGCENPSPYR